MRTETGFLPEPSLNTRREAREAEEKLVLARAARHATLTSRTMIELRCQQLGAALRSARKAKGWPIEYLADLTGLSAELIRQIERSGQTSTEIFALFEMVLGVSPLAQHLDQIP